MYQMVHDESMEHRVSATASAAPSDVWRLFTDMERWPELIGSITALRRLDTGPLTVGSEVQLKQPAFPPTRWRVTEMRPGRSFAWESASGGMTTVGDHIVEPHGGDGSLITLTLRTRGPLSGLMSALVGRRSLSYITMELDGFRRAAEAARA
jgi:uncharacterized membrane protein